jgi:transcription termination/antitermination protein NusG
MAMKWYGVHTYSGYENKVKLNLEERIRALGVEESFGEVLDSF